MPNRLMQEEYVHRGILCCPECQHADVEVYQKRRGTPLYICPSCNVMWQNRYELRLIGYQIIGTEIPTVGK